MQQHNLYMQRCLVLAQKGLGTVAPNPMVGCVIVHNNKIIGEGYHEVYGEAHAEVNAINSVENKELLKEATVYVSLEPCNHFGKTPPCSDLLVKHQVKKVVIGCVDSFDKVAGKGIEKLKNAGIEVLCGVLENECRALNKRFFTFHEKKRPYIFLKWAQTKDGFIANKDNTWISGAESKVLVHQWRSEEAAILVGANTARIDNPQLTTRLVKGKNPVRVLIDLSLKTPANSNIFNSEAPTLVFNTLKNAQENNIEWIKIEVQNILQQLCTVIYEKGINSLIVEGGSITLQHFIQHNLWDEALIFESTKEFKNGVKAPQIALNSAQFSFIGKDKLYTLFNK